MSTEATGITPAWRALLAAAYRPDDDDWQCGDGGDLLLAVVIELMHPPALDSSRVTDDQLAEALDRATNGATR